VNIGGAVVRRLLTDSEALVFNLDKCGYASDLTCIEQVLAELGDRASTPEGESRHQLLQVDLTDAGATAEAVRQADPDLVMHLAAESHVDRSIEGPGAYGSTSSPNCVNITSNVNGTFHLLQAVRSHWEALPAERQGRKDLGFCMTHCLAQIHWCHRDLGSFRVVCGELQANLRATRLLDPMIALSSLWLPKCVKFSQTNTLGIKLINPLTLAVLT
jgi:NAD(P)-dependent dehydrogenase (short-subunit alcohol dehydrogenase family)